MLIDPDSVECSSFPNIFQRERQRFLGFLNKIKDDLTGGKMTAFCPVSF